MKPTTSTTCPFSLSQVLPLLFSPTSARIDGGLLPTPREAAQELHRSAEIACSPSSSSEEYSPSFRRAICKVRFTHGTDGKGSSSLVGSVRLTKPSHNLGAWWCYPPQVAAHGPRKSPEAKIRDFLSCACRTGTRQITHQAEQGAMALTSRRSLPSDSRSC